MRDFFFGFAKACQWTFDTFWVSMGWVLPVLFACVLAFGAIFWMSAQAKYTARAKERKEYI